MRKKKHSKKKVKDGEMDIDRQPSRQAGKCKFSRIDRRRI